MKTDISSVPPLSKDSLFSLVLIRKRFLASTVKRSLITRETLQCAIRISLKGLADTVPEEDRKPKQKVQWKEALRLLLNVSCVQKNKFYIPGETVENERHRVLANSTGLYLALRLLAERIESREQREALNSEFVQQLDLTDTAMMRAMLAGMRERRRIAPEGALHEVIPEEERDNSISVSEEPGSNPSSPKRLHLN